MSGQLRTLKNRIRSVESTKKITRAMEMVAAAKLHRLQDAMTKARPYTEGLRKLVSRLMETQNADGAGSAASGQGPGAAAPMHPFFESREEKKAALVLITSDTGLCGSYNQELIERARRFLNPAVPGPRVPGKGLAPPPVTIMGVGKSGISALKRAGHASEKTWTDLRAGRADEIFHELKSYLETIFIEKQVDAVYVIYSHLVAAAAYQGVTEKLLPLTKPLRPPGGGEDSPGGACAVPGAGVAAAGYIFEPSPEAVFQKLIPVFFEAETRRIFLEALVSEQIARMRAMHQATENAKEMIDSLVLQRNKVRQAAITKELIEVVSGSQALKIK